MSIVIPVCAAKSILIPSKYQKLSFNKSTNWPADPEELNNDGCSNLQVAGSVCGPEYLHEVVMNYNSLFILSNCSSYLLGLLIHQLITMI